MPDYKFTQPIRYYKSNDPYYFEIDNIPIRQLEENILSLKQGLERGEFDSGSGGSDGGTGGTYLTNSSELDMENIKQLKPKLSGIRSLSVNAGKFNARINSAYDITEPLNRLVAGVVTGGDIDPFASDEPGIIPDFTREWGQDDIQRVWDNLTVAGELRFYNLNGLETAYTFHQTPGSLGSAWDTTTSTDLGLNSSDEGGGTYPHYNTSDSTRIRWPNQTLGALTPDDLSSALKYAGDYSPTKLQDIHLAFVRMWRSVFRTAVVDFPQSSIDIPAWDDSDFYYYDDAGERVEIDDVTQRIDLVFAYAVPIDVTKTEVNDFSENYCTDGAQQNPKTLTAPALGIIRGAGVGIKKKLNSSSEIIGIETTEGCGDIGTPGTNRILSSKNDGLEDSNLGITDINGSKVHGSFPSPDDLINQAANLYTVDGDDYRKSLNLIGQSALPVAYVVVKKGTTTLSDADVIDIRPFLRTTELTYNERAGIAGANPALSFANPAVGAFQLKDAVRRVYNKIQVVENSTQSTLLGKPVYMDYVMGGLAYGVEGTILTMNNNNNADSDPWGTTTTLVTDYNGFSFADYTSSKEYLDDRTVNRRKALLEYFYTTRQADLKKWLSDPNQSNNDTTYLNLGDNRNVPIFPEWQIAVDQTNWSEVFNNNSHQAADPTWWMWLEGVSKERPLRYVPGGVVSVNSADESGNLDEEYLPGFGLDDAQGFIQSCMKRIEIKLPSWAHDYDVIAEYVNCNPYGGQIDKSATKNQLLLGSGISVNKGAIKSNHTAEFTITSAAQGLPAGPLGMVYQGKILDQFGNGTNDPNTNQTSKIQSRLYEWLSYSVCLPEFKETGWRTGTQQSAQQDSFRKYTPKMGASYYPTVKFTIIAYPESPINNNKSYLTGGANSSSKTLIPDNTLGGSHASFDSIAPVYESTFIDINDIAY